MRTGERWMTGSRMVAAVGLLSGVLALLATPTGASAGATERVSVDSAGNEGDGGSASRPAINPDGRFVAFTSLATNLVPGDTNGTWDVFIRDRQTGTTERVSVDSAGNQVSGWYPAISADGRVVVFLSPSSYGTGLFVRDRSAGTTERIGWNFYSLSNPSIHADRRVVAWTTHAVSVA